jgi:exodeoxyribonuclease V beta subunit
MQAGERRITNFRHLIDLLQAEHLQRGSQFEHVLRWFSQEVGSASDRTDVDERQLQLESDADAVRIITMHTAKGLEFPLVFCPYLWNAREVEGVKKVTVAEGDAQEEGNPDAGTYFVQTSLLSGEAATTWTPRIERLTLEENLRLAYVALTRAQVKVWIYGGKVTKKPLPPSALDWLLREDDANPSNIPTDGRGCSHAKGVQYLSSNCEDSEAIVCIPPPQGTNVVKWLGADESKDSEPEALESPRVGAGWVMTSFSSLTREKSPHAPSEPASIAAAPHQQEAKPLNAFAIAPGGTLMGNALHGWIEEWDFKPIHTEELLRYLEKFPFPSGSDKGDKSTGRRIEEMLSELRDARLEGLDCSIHQACPHPEASEWHFHLPIKEGLSASSLGDVFANHGMHSYAEMLQALPAENLKGYLHGFLDRIARYGDSWGVIDWKTNRLRGDDYGPESLMECAMQSHYLLQAHLYLVALRRRLGPGAKIAGAWVVFLRGIHAESTDGILHICPRENLLSDLDDLFEKPSQQLR